MWKDAITQFGYFVFSPLFSSGELEPLLDAFAQPGLARSRAGIRHALSIEAVSNIARDPRLLGIAKEVLGPAAAPYHATLFEKSPDANWLVVWHQDTALPLRERKDKAGWGPWSVKEGINYAHAPATALSNVLALRLHLDDSTKDNGPLRVLMGTHIGACLRTTLCTNYLNRSHPWIASLKAAVWSQCVPFWFTHRPNR